ncbi:MAG TPA: DUF1631 family protein [Gammaproteobacteria bacterium]
MSTVPTDLEHNSDNSKPEPDFVSKVISEFIHADSEDAAKPAVQAKSPAGNKQHFNRQDIIKALTNLQLTYKSEYIPGQKTNINTDGFKKALLNSMAKLSSGAFPKAMNQIDGRTIDFVEMIFGAFLRDHNISDAIKTLLLKLQIPVIKTALLDSRFFHDNRHPARNALDTVAHIGIGIDSNESTVYKTMDLILEQLLNAFDQNINSFNTALSSLSRLKRIEQDKHDENESVTKKRILQEHARHIVLTELQIQTNKVSISKDLQPLILKHWSTLMLRSYLHHGKPSEQWTDSVNQLAVILRSIKPISSTEEWLLLTSNSDKVIDKSRTMLLESKQDAKLIDAAIKPLRDIHQKLLNESEFKQDTNSVDITSVSDELLHEKADTSTTERNAEIAREKLAQLPSDVKHGVWFEIYDGDNKPVRRLKLSVVLMEQARLVFVDRLGQEVLEKDADTFSEELKTNKSRLLADHSVFDFALSQVISSLTNK